MQYLIYKNRLPIFTKNFFVQNYKLFYYAECLLNMIENIIFINNNMKNFIIL